jgi:hypothetical protein
MRKLILMAVASFLWKKYAASRQATDRNMTAGNIAGTTRGSV